MKPYARRKARKLLVQALYQWQLAKPTITDLQKQFLQDCNPKKIDTEYLAAVLSDIIGNMVTIDKQLVKYLDREITAINPVELAILRLAIYELLKQLDIPPKVIINEAIELAKTFCSAEAAKYVNGVLDNAAQNLRNLTKN